MCELSVYAVDGDKREKLMEGVVRLISRNGKILMEGILGDSMEVGGRLGEVDIIAQEATIFSQ
ncbi:MAG TPA: CooT family nickel-binding protein [Methanotrichaceae archaeon]|nr:CooT family nickel-binding protein [Methanotrichaceae archaeon]